VKRTASAQFWLVTAETFLKFMKLAESSITQKRFSYFHELFCPQCEPHSLTGILKRCSYEFSEYEYSAPTRIRNDKGREVNSP